MNKKPIKLIVSDMDGTLLDSNGILNPEFFTVFKDLSSEDIMFVAASGRQYYNLLKLFSSIKDKIIFTGYIDYEDMPSIYQLSNIAVLPSMWDEPAGMTMVEAVASGLPLITTNSGGIPEYIPNKLAVILNRDDKLVENITENILNLKQNGWEEDQHSLNQFRSEMCLRHYYQEFSNIINKR